MSEAKQLVRRWAVEEAAGMRGVRGAYLAGSITWLPEEADLPATSDVDVTVVLAGDERPAQGGKVLYRGALLDVAYLPADALGTAESVLGDYHRAGAFRAPNVILDPTGELAKLQAAVAKGYAKRVWVRRRCEHARTHSLRYVRSLHESQPWHDQVTSWLFATGITTHVLLVAGLRNPTVRRRYEAARELLAEYGRLDFYESLLELLGCARMGRERVERHLEALADAFDAAKAAIRTPFSFASDISDAARPIAIDGSRELIERGLHREAVFWIAVTYARCQHIFHQDAPELEKRYAAGFRELVGDLGVASFADRRRRVEEVEAFLPRVMEAAEEIMAGSGGIKD